jgi:hypothetical protein
MLNMGLFFPALVLYMLYVVYWSIKVFRAFRVPDRGEDVPRGGERTGG